MKFEHKLSMLLVEEKGNIEKIKIELIAENNTLNALVQSYREMARHAHYPHPDCSDEKKMLFINASKKVDEFEAALAQLRGEQGKEPLKIIP